MENATQLYEFLGRATDENKELYFDGFCFYLLENGKRNPHPSSMSSWKFKQANDFMRRVVKECPDFLHNSFSCRNGVMLLKLNDDNLFEWKWGIRDSLESLIDTEHDGDMTLLSELTETMKRYRNALPDVRKEIVDKVWESIRDFDFELIPNVGQKCGNDIEWLMLPAKRCH